MKQWMSDISGIFLILKCISRVFSMGFVLTGSIIMVQANDYVDLSKSFLNSLKHGQDVAHIVQKYESLSFEELKQGLETQEEKLAFWINTYNGFIIYTLKDDPSKFDERGSFFSNKQIHIAGYDYSFDNIEHGIIRNSRIKWSLGYLKKWFVPDYISDLAIQKREPRIHFALNCGANSCPPVAIYDAQTVDQQLDISTQQYLEHKTTIKGVKVITTPLFSWFRGDFGGISGVEKMLKNYGIIDKQKDITLEFDSYDWTLNIDNYIEL